VAHKVVLLDSASTDLTELGLYIASQSGVQVANGYLDRIYATCMGLAAFPERGRRRDDILPGFRTIGFERRVTIGFRVFKKQVQIITIAYGGRDFESELRKGK
jgi:toxin ParE1/3/4